VPLKPDNVNASGNDGNPVARFFSRVGAGISGFFGRTVRAGKQRFTVMFIPHSERKVLNFQINAFTLVFAVVIVAVLVGGFFFLSTMFSGSERLISEKSNDLKNTRASLDSILNELSEVAKVAQVFDGTLSQTVKSLDVDGPGSGTPQNSDAGGDLSAFMNLQEVDPGEIRQLQQLRNLSTTLKSSIEPLTQIREVIQAQKSLLSDLPNFWPVAAGRGRVTMEFGPNVHPVTNQWYIHKGFDIADSVGVPVVASANGKVTELGVDPGYGLYVWIRHKYGFRTRYSHLQTIEVSEGQEVIQGQRIGTLGNSGVSTGPHLDFQIWLGTDVVDPAAFLKISNDFRRWQGNRQ